MSSPKRASESIVTLEFCHSRTREEPPWSIVLSLGTRDSTLTRSWGTPGRAMTVAEFDDLWSWVYERLFDAVSIREGLQGQFPT
jgi:hypothetical protein